MDELKLQKEQPNTIILHFNDEEYIEINEIGFYYKGKLIENDKDIYKAFKNFLKKAGKPSLLSPYQVD